MPTILHVQGFRIGFFSHEPNEPPHVHVAHTGRRAKFWLEPVEVQWNRGYSEHELWQIVRILEENRGLLIAKWHEHHG